MRAVLAPTVFVAVTALCTTSCQTPGAGGTGTVVLPARPALFLRATPDSDASSLIGLFVPDNVDAADVDEARAMRTRCSRFITPSRVAASGEFREITGVSTGALANVGVRNIARVGLGGREQQALLVHYLLAEKITATVDADGLAQCCAAAPDQCTRRFIGGAVRGDGSYYSAVDRVAGGELDAAGLVKNLPIDAGVVADNALTWQRQGAFHDQFFAFSLQGTATPVAPAANDCSWANSVPTSLDGDYFVGVSNPLPSEKLAREDAMRDAREQVVRFLGEFLSESTATTQSTSGKADDLQVLFADEQRRESLAHGVARFVKDQRWCGPTEQATPSGMKQSVKVLAFFPHAERKAAALAALRGLLDERQARGGSTTSIAALLRSIEAQP